MKLSKSLLLITVGILWLTIPACGKDATDEPESPLSFISPQIAPTVLPATPTPPPLQIPTPSPGLAVVHGRIVSPSPETGIFLAGDIYLASLIYTDGQTQIPILSLDTANDPRATLRNKAHEFAIIDVPPGEYGIIINTLMNDYIVPDGEGGFLIIDVEEDTVLNLSVIELQ